MEQDASLYGSCLQQDAQLFQGGPDPLKGGLAWAGDGVQVDTLREVGQGRASDWRQRSTNWATSYRLDSWRGPVRLAVDRMLHNDVDHRTALVHDGVDSSSIWSARWRQARADQPAPFLREHIPPSG